jgi:hypothetical protein
MTPQEVNRLTDLHHTNASMASLQPSTRSAKRLDLRAISRYQQPRFRYQQMYQHFVSLGGREHATAISKIAENSLKIAL